MPPAKNSRRTPSARPRPARPSFPTRPAGPTRPTGRVQIRRRKPEPKGAQKLLAMLGGTAGKAGRAAPSSAKGKGGLALLGAGAVAALSQRDKLAGLFGKGSSEPEETVTPVDVAPVPPVAPPAI